MSISEYDKSMPTVSQEDVIAELRGRIYKAALYFEELEHLGLIDGNGHHIAQSIADHCTKLLVDRWCGNNV